MLKSIIIVTILTLNAEKSENSYAKLLDYQSVESGFISENLANSWNAKLVSGARYTLMKPRSNKPVYVRFIEQDNALEHQPMKQLGWNATEILVQNPDKLAKEFASSPFNVVGQPKFLTSKQNVRAFQATGPNNELLYFTRITDPAASSFDLGMAMTEIDNVFIMVMGTSDIAATKRFYESTLGTPVSGPFPYKIGVLSNSYDLPADTIHSLSLAQLSGQFLIEIDQYPNDAKTLVKQPGKLSAGIAMVSFLVNNLSEFNLDYIAPPNKKIAAPYYGRMSATAIGTEGELIELIEYSSNDKP